MFLEKLFCFEECFALFSLVGPSLTFSFEKKSLASTVKHLHALTLFYSDYSSFEKNKSAMETP
jgi:hypothetical protein